MAAWGGEPGGYAMRYHALLGPAWAVFAVQFAAPFAVAQEIHSCINKKGSIRIVADPSQCKSSETPLSWNQVGPQGPIGLPGLSSSGKLRSV